MKTSGLTPKEALVHGALLLLPLMVLFPGVFFRGEVAMPGGLLSEIDPWRRYMSDAQVPRNRLTQETLMQGSNWYVHSARTVRAGEWPLWNELQLAGIPMLANSQSSVFYPPRLLHLFLDPFYATTLCVLLKIWMCGMTAYFCGRTLALGVSSAQFLSLAWMLNGFIMHWAYWPPGDSIVWGPVLLTGAELLLRMHYRKGFFALSLGATLVLLAGQPETAFTQSLGVGVYFALRTAWEFGHGRNPLPDVALAGASWCVALAVTAAFIVPVFEYIPNSAQFANIVPAREAFSSLSVQAVIAFWVPRFLGANVDSNFWGEHNSNFVGILYPGIAVTIGASLLLSRGPKNPGRDAVTACLTPSCILFLLMAFGSPFLRAAGELQLLNAMTGFHYAAPALWAFALLAAMGVQKWFSQPRQLWDARWPILASLVIGSVLLIFLTAFPLADHELRRYVYAQCVIAALFALASLVVVVAHCWWSHPRRLATLFVLLLAIDLLVAARGLSPSSPRRHLFPDTKLTRFIEELPRPHRIWAGNTRIVPGFLQHYNIEEWFGYDGIEPAREKRYFGKCCFTACWLRALQIAAVDYHLYSDQKEPVSDVRRSLTPVAELDGVEVWRDPKALPRARLIGRVEVVPDADALFARMCAPDFDPAMAALTDEPPDAPLPETTSADLGRADIATRTSTHLAVNVHANADCVLVVADAYYPGWRATIDGVVTEIFPLYHVFRGVTIPAGDHVVEFTYSPWSFRLGLTISIVAMAVSIAGSVLLLLRRPRRRSVPAGCD